MKIKTGATAIALALLMTGCGGGDSDLNAVAANGAAPLTQIAAPNNGDWREVVNRTPQGATVVGNPDAPVKLVEYGSLTCPACRAFSMTGTRPLLDTYVASGQVSWEFRHLVIHGGPDVVLSMLSDCQAPAAFFRTIEDIYTQQSEILGNLDQAQNLAQIQAMPPEQQLAPIARAMQLDSFFARRGMPEARFNQCLANLPAAQQLADNLSRAQTEGVSGTPSFSINGERLEATSWPEVEQRLRAAIGG